MSVLLFSLVDGIAYVTLNRPRSKNALDAELLSEIDGCFEYIENDCSIKAVVMTGAGDAFCSGADLKKFPIPAESERPADKNNDFIYDTMEKSFNRIILKISECRCPVVTGINGLAVGGGVGLAFSGDIAIASENSSYTLPFIPQLGLVPDLGAAWQVSRRIGIERANYYSLTGFTITAQNAFEWGLVSDLTPDDKLLDVCANIAIKLTNIDSEELVAHRKLMEKIFSSELSSQLRCEAKYQSKLAARSKFIGTLKSFRKNSSVG